MGALHPPIDPCRQFGALMEPRDFGAAWANTADFVTANASLLLPIAGMFLFLPQLLFQYGTQDFIPGQPAPAGSGLRIALLIGLLLATSVLGQLTITRMSAGESQSGLTLGEQLSLSLAVLLPAIGALLIQTIAIFSGLMLLIIPGLYLIGRLLFVLPVMACETRDPIKALKRSWSLTEGNGFRLLAFVLFLLLGIIMISVLLGGLGAAIGVVGTVAAGGQPAEGWGLGRWLFELINVGVSSALSVIYIIFIAQLYRAFRT